MQILFTPYTIGGLRLPNRILMAPLTRCRAGAERIPNEIMVEYYRQRAAAGLIITEATIVSPQGAGYVDTPGIYNAAQVRGWSRVTQAVHAEGGRIFLQLWHTGRSSHPAFQPRGALPVAPSAIRIRGEAHTYTGKKPYPVPRALEAREIPGIVADFAQGARLAREAGFDGVEIHAANGYLIDQFLRDGTNHRLDAYGGSVEKRARFLLEVTERVAAAWQPERVGVRLSPTNPFNDMQDSDPAATFGYAAAQLDHFGLAYLHITEQLQSDPDRSVPPPVAPLLRQAFQGPFILNGGYDARGGARAIHEGEADLIAFGVPFLTTPDLVARYRQGMAPNPPDFATFYEGGPKGYIDYPVHVAGVGA